MLYFFWKFLHCQTKRNKTKRYVKAKCLAKKPNGKYPLDLAIMELAIDDKIREREREREKGVSL